MNKTKGLFSNKIFLIATALLCLCAYFLYLLLLSAKVPLNSDFATQVLIANDMLSGNWFLSGWNLTGITFYGTELPFYVLGSFLFGIDTNAYILAIGIMAFLLTLSGALLALQGDKTNRYRKILLYFAFMGAPSLFCLSFMRGHSGAIIFGFISLFFIAQENDQHHFHPLSLMIWGFFLIVCTMSDSIIYLFLIIPVIFVTIFQLVFDSIPNRSFYIKRLIFIFLFSAAGGILSHVLYLVGKFNKNDFFFTRKFIDMTLWYEKAGLLFDSLLRIFRCEVSLTQIISFSTVKNFIAMLFFLMSIFIITKTIIRTIRQPQKTFDFISVTLSTGIVLFLLVCFITDIFSKTESTRYIAWIPFASAIILAREWGKPQNKLLHQKEWGIAFTCIILFTLWLHPVTLRRAVTKQDHLAQFLIENNLRNGYSDFWTASHTTVASENHVTLRPVRVFAKKIGEPFQLRMQNWFDKTDWYKDSANFIVISGENYLDVNEKYILTLLGEPAKRLIGPNEYIIFIYNHNITEKIVIDQSAAKGKK